MGTQINSPPEQSPVRVPRAPCASAEPHAHPRSPVHVPRTPCASPGPHARPQSPLCVPRAPCVSPGPHARVPSTESAGGRRGCCCRCPGQVNLTPGPAALPAHPGIAAGVRGCRKEMKPNQTKPNHFKKSRKENATALSFFHGKTVKGKPVPDYRGSKIQPLKCRIQTLSPTLFRPALCPAQDCSP